jgi:ATP-dependent DNA helicase RecQ
MLDAMCFKSSFNRPNLYYEIRPKVHATKEIIRFIKNNPENQVSYIALAVKRSKSWQKLL